MNARKAGFAANQVVRVALGAPSFAGESVRFLAIGKGPNGEPFGMVEFNGTSRWIAMADLSEDHDPIVSGFGELAPTKVLYAEDVAEIERCFQQVQSKAREFLVSLPFSILSEYESMIAHMTRKHSAILETLHSLEKKT